MSNCFFFVKCGYVGCENDDKSCQVARSIIQQSAVRPVEYAHAQNVCYIKCIRSHAKSFIYYIWSRNDFICLEN